MLKENFPVLCRNVLADSCARFVTCAMYLIFSRKTFYNLLPFERIERVIHILHLKQQMNLGLFFFFSSIYSTLNCDRYL